VVARAALADELIRTVSGDGGVSARALVATGLVSEAVSRHGTAPTSSAALGRALMGALLLADGAQDQETVQLQFRGDGPIGAVTAIADGAGRARGYAQRPATHPPSRGGKLDVAAAVGRGILAVVRYHPSWRQPYRGVVPLESGEIAEDVARYLGESEQTASAVGLGVFVGSRGDVLVAGGFLVQALPDAAPETLARLETNVATLPSPTEMLRAGLSSDDVLDRLLESLGSRERSRSQPRFFCGCDPERVRRAVVLLGRDELRALRERGESIGVHCEFCGDDHLVHPDELGALVPDA
jgi:molecular chaperone Hsp33